VSALTSLYFT